MTSGRWPSAVPSRGLTAVRVERRQICFAAEDAAVAELSQALVESGVLIHALAPETVTLEDLFFSLTEGVDSAGTDAVPGPTRAGGGGGVNPGIATVYRWELFKLRYQKRTYLGLGAAAIVPILFVIAIHFRHQDRHGGDFAFSSYLTRSGLAVPLVIMLFGAVWMFPLITALVAGDIFASEDHNGTLKTILTRSLERHQIFAGKTLAAATYAVTAILINVTVAVIAGSLQSGFHSLQSLSGTIVSAPKGLELVYVGTARVPDPDRHHRVHRAPALLGDAQQRGGGGGHPDGLAPLSAHRRASRAGRGAAVPAQHAVQRLAGPAAHSYRLGADHPRRLGVRACTGSRRSWPPSWFSCAGTWPAARGFS